MNNGFSKRIAFIGVISALVFCLLLLETQVLNGILPVTPCYLSLPLAISISVFSKKKRDFFIGGSVFGVCSFILAFVFGQSWFLNPLISILPRIIFGVTAGFVYLGVGKIFENSTKIFFGKIFPAAVAGIVGAITNTVLVVLGFFVFGWQDLENALLTILSFNALIEIICSAILVPIFTKVEEKFYYIGGVG